MKDSRGHIFYFDWLRIIAAFFVVFMHVASVPLAGDINTDWHLTNILTSLSFTAVPLFFMMSGYLLLSSERTADVSVLFKKRLPRLVAPLLFWTVFSVFYKLWLDGTITAAGVWQGLFSSLSSPAWVHLWYMYTLIALYVLSPFLRASLSNLSRGGHILALSIIGLITLRAMLSPLLPQRFSNLINIDIINKLEFFGGHLATFILGYYLGSIRKKFPNTLLAAGAAAVLAVIIFGTYLISSANGKYLQDFQRQSAGFEVILASLIFLLFKQNTKREVSSPAVSSLVSLTLPIYLIHNFPLYYINRIGLGAVTFADTFRLSVILFAACVFISMVLSSIPFLSFAATGLSFREANGSCNLVFMFKRIFKKK